MRKTRPVVGTIKHVSKFLVFPKYEQGVFRWLEKAEWDEEYRKISWASLFGDYGWEFVAWLDLEESDVPEYNDENFE